MAENGLMLCALSCVQIEFYSTHRATCEKEMIGVFVCKMALTAWLARTPVMCNFAILNFSQTTMVRRK